MTGDDEAIRQACRLERVRGDDTSDWIGEIEENREDDDAGSENRTDNDGSGSGSWPGSWIDDLDTGSDEVNSVDRSIPDSEHQDVTELTLTVGVPRCRSCGATSGRSYHSACEAPIVSINNAWFCGGCASEITPQMTCTDCGGNVEYDSVDVPLDMGPDFRIDDVERAIHRETNRHRSNHGLDTLYYNNHLSAVALQHSRDMADRDFFDHTNPDGLDAVDRYQKFGHDIHSSGENIALIPLTPTTTIDEAAERVVQDWMDSPGHRKNILRNQFAKEGIGVYISSDGGMYATQNFY